MGNKKQTTIKHHMNKGQCNIARICALRKPRVQYKRATWKFSLGGGDSENVKMSEYSIN